MDLKTLNRFRSLKKAIRYLRAEIEKEYYPVHSVKYDDYISSTHDYQGPTLKALDIIESKNGKLDRLLIEYTKLENDINQWLDDLNDPIAEVIIKYRFLLNKTWNQTGRLVYGRNNAGEACRKYVYRMFEKEKMKDQKDPEEKEI